jgi:hypothetical protein
MDLLEMRIENIGRRPATDVRIAWAGPLPNALHRGGEDINELPLWDGVPLLVPGEMFRIDFGMARDLLKEDRQQFTAELTYGQEGRRRTFKSKSTVDVSIFIGTSIADTGGAWDLLPNRPMPGN